jgi:hypothetical protein
LFAWVGIDVRAVNIGWDWVLGVPVEYHPDRYSKRGKAEIKMLKRGKTDGRRGGLRRGGGFERVAV